MDGGVKKGDSRESSRAEALAMRKFVGEKYPPGSPDPARRTIVVGTSGGPVEVLCYGFDRAERTPLVITMHGGGFVMGRAGDDEAMNLAIAGATGFRVASVEYPLAPEHPFPAAVQAVMAVARHLRDMAEAYGIDPDRVGIMGHSAGANLATVACMEARAAGPSFKCQVLDYPPLDLATDPGAKPQPEGCIPPETARMFNECYGTPGALADPRASPLLAGADSLRGMPAALIVLAGRDSLHDEGVAYAGKLRSVGVEVELADYPAALHGFTFGESDDARDARGRMIAFLKARLG